MDQCWQSGWRLRSADRRLVTQPCEPTGRGGAQRGGVTHFPPRCHIQIVRAWSGRSDAELLALEDPDAFAELYDRYVSQILAWSSVRVGDYGADLTAEAFAVAWRSRKRFRDEHNGSALPWLYGIANNVFRTSLRKRRVEYRARERLGLPATVMHADFEAVEDRLSFPSAVLRAVANLPDSERELLVLRLVEQRPYNEIAQRLHCTPVAARLRVSRSLRRLHLALGGF
jgi:RNA polymerase sigma-70 factor, ECF subfamily